MENVAFRVPNASLTGEKNLIFFVGGNVRYPFI